MLHAHWPRWKQTKVYRACNILFNVFWVGPWRQYHKAYTYIMYLSKESVFDPRPVAYTTYHWCMSRGASHVLSACTSNLVCNILVVSIIPCGKFFLRLSLATWLPSKLAKRSFANLFGAGSIRSCHLHMCFSTNSFERNATETHAYK